MLYVSHHSVPCRLCWLASAAPIRPLTVNASPGTLQEARDAWSARVSALQKRWQASFMRGDGWGMRGGGNPAADRDAALRLTFGLIVRMYAYKDALQDLAEQDPACLEAFAPQARFRCGL